MADLSKLRPRSRLGSPPPLTEASPNLEAPEIAPSPDIAPRPAPAPRAAAAPAPRREPARASGAGEGAPRRRDGRSARRTGRTVQFATRVSPEFDDRVREIAEREGILLVEVLERALEAYEASRAEDRG